MKKLIAGNWKMNGTAVMARDLVQAVFEGVEGDAPLRAKCDFVICPPYPYLSLAAKGGAAVALGAQDCTAQTNGAYTGDVSAAMLADVGCSYVILGHSERRLYHGETDRGIADKARAAWAAGLVVIICVGESEAERGRDRQEAVVGCQLRDCVPDGATAANMVIAYEPIWAIGTGKNATPADVGALHRFIRDSLKEKLADFANVRILYGGSVKPDNAAALFAVENVDGALIGGASLKADQFLAIAKAVKG